MKNIKTYFILFWIGHSIINPCQAQVIINISQPQSFQVKVSDMFIADLMNTTALTYKIYIIGTIINSKTGQKIVEGKSQSIDLLPGSRHVNENILSPVYSYSSSVTEQTGYLTYGLYHICLTAHSTADNEEKGAECIDVEVTPLSPPLLLSPENGSTILTNYPLLIWLPPTPVNNRINILYDLKLVQLTENQTAYDAIQRNFSIFEQQNLRLTNLQYPANALRLLEGKTYAWKILAKTSDGAMIGETEVWTFSPGKEKENIDVKPAIYGALSKNLDAGYYTVIDKKLYFRYIEQYKNDVLNFKIINEKSQDIRKGCSLDLKKQPGDNRFMIDLKDCSNISKGMYTLEVSNEKNEWYKLKFKVE